MQLRRGHSGPAFHEMAIFHEYKINKNELFFAKLAKVISILKFGTVDYDTNLITTIDLHR
jgi:hypothetical protein